jgi:predicted permease
VVAQVAFSLLLLAGAGLVLRSLEKIRPTRVGFSSENLLVAPVALNPERYDRVKAHEFYRQMSERVGALPGVQAVTLVDAIQGGFLGRARSTTEIEGYQARPGEDLQIDAFTAGPHYFTNMKVPLVQGRDFDERDRDGAPCVAVINQAFVQKYFAGRAALGKHLTKFAGTDDGQVRKEPCEIVGIVRDDAWQSFQKDLRPFFTLALLQSNRKRTTMLVSTTGAPGSLLTPVRNTIREIDPRIPLTDVQTLGEYFAVGLYPFRILAVLMGACGVMALLLASLGIYGIISYSVAQRTRELGIRIALGALRKDILKMVIWQGMVLVVTGLGLGLLLSIALTRLLTSSLLELELPFPVSATDPLTFASVTMLLALIACFIPARRATKIDPIDALRYE